MQRPSQNADCVCNGHTRLTHVGAYAYARANVRAFAGRRYCGNDYKRGRRQFAGRSRAHQLGACTLPRTHPHTGDTRESTSARACVPSIAHQLTPSGFGLVHGLMASDHTGSASAPPSALGGAEVMYSGSIEGVCAVLNGIRGQSDEV